MIKHTLLVIDDGSIDNTGSIAQKMGAKVIRHSKNMGGASAVKTGLLYAAKHDFDYAVRLDADGQHMPKYIPLYLKFLKNDDVDWINGSRYLGHNIITYDYKSIGRKFYSFITSKLTGKKITDVTNGFRGYDSKAIKFLANKYPEGRFNAVEEAIMAARNLNIIELEIIVKKRLYGNSKTFNMLNLILYQPYMILAIIKGYIKSILF